MGGNRRFRAGLLGVVVLASILGIVLLMLFAPASSPLAMQATPAATVNATEATPSATPSVAPTVASLPTATSAAAPNGAASSDAAATSSSTPATTATAAATAALPTATTAAIPAAAPSATVGATLGTIPGAANGPTSVATAAVPTAAPSAGAGAGELLAYLQGGDLWIARPDGSERWQITRGAVVDWFAWSPRGNEFVLSTRAPDGSAGGVFVQGVDGTEARRLDAAARTPTAGRRAAWSPTGGQLALADDDGVLIVDRQGEQPRRYALRLPGTGQADTGPTVAVGTPAWYPDGQRLLLPMAGRADIGAEGNTRIRWYSLNLTDSSVAPVATDLPLMGGRLPENTSFSPDGQAFGYTTYAALNTCEEYGFFERLDVAGRSLLLVDPQPAPAPTVRSSSEAQAVGASGWNLTPRGYSWAPDSRRVAVAFNFRECAGSAAAPAAPQIYLTQSGGETLALGRGVDPAWSPRGETIAYASDELPPTLRVRDLTANTERNLGPGERPAWQPVPR